MASTTIDMGKVLKEKCIVTIHVKMPYAWKLRFKVGAWFIFLGAWVAGLGFKVVGEEREKLVDRVGIHLCGCCPQYDLYGSENCRIGYVAPSDCPHSRDGAIAIIEEFIEGR